MKILCGGGGVHDSKVVLGRQLQKTLKAGAGVLRPLALVSMWKEEAKCRPCVPLGACRSQELVDDDLAYVGKIAELRLPEHERLRRVHAIPVLKAHHRHLTERAVVDRKRGASLRQMLQRHVLRSSLRVMQN